MASQSPTTTTVETFLSTDLTLHTHSKFNSKCHICTVSWREEAKSVVSLPCKHFYHKSCITTWIEEGVSKLATCPDCRRKLCTRTKEPENNFDLEFGTEEFEEAWEGFSVSVTWLSARASTVEKLVRLALSN